MLLRRTAERISGCLRMAMSQQAEVTMKILSKIAIGAAGIALFSAAAFADEVTTTTTQRTQEPGPAFMSAFLASLAFRWARRRVHARPGVEQRPTPTLALPDR
jgi:uncharacterized protein (TIGR03382 family)